MKILNKLVFKNLKKDKTKTLTTCIGVVLTSILLFSLGLILSSLRENTITKMGKSNGNYHTYFEDIKQSKIKDIIDHKNVSSVLIKKDIFTLKYRASNDNVYPFINFDIIGIDKDTINNIEIIEGNLPKSGKEIIINEEIKTEHNFIIGNTYSFLVDEEVFNYKVVGVFDKSPYNYHAVYTVIDNEYEKYDVIVFFNNIKNIASSSFEIGKKLDLICGLGHFDKMCINMQINENILFWNGIIRDNHVRNMIYLNIFIILTVISVIGAYVIYNSFTISVIEKNKTFGMLSSIGASKSQIFSSILFEAFLVSLISIPIGFLLSCGILKLILFFLNNLLNTNYIISLYMPFIMVSMIFIILTVLISSILPAIKASKITPINSIKLLEDIKFKNKKIKIDPFVKKIFGIEASISFKNIKRNKKKYTVTTRSIIISVVLFITASTFISWAMPIINLNQFIPNYDIELTFKSDDPKDYGILIDKIKNNSTIKQFSAGRTAVITIDKINDDWYHDDFLNQINKIKNNYPSFKYEPMKMLQLVMLDDYTYKSYIKTIGLDKDKPILINKVSTKLPIYYYDNSQSFVMFKSKMLKEIDSINFDLCTDEETQNTNLECPYTIDDIYFTQTPPFGYNDYLNLIPIFIVSEERFNTITNLLKDKGMYIWDGYNFYINSNNFNSFEKDIVMPYNRLFFDSYDDESGFEYIFSYKNYTKEMREVKNIVLAIKICLYTIVALITTIAITSIFSTIITSMHLRKKEFAMLRSIGLTPKGFNKVLIFESVFFGLKSLIFALPISAILISLVLKFFKLSDKNFEKNTNLPSPTIYFIISILAVFIVVFLTSLYSTRKIKKENILDALKENSF